MSAEPELGASLWASLEAFANANPGLISLLPALSPLVIAVSVFVAIRSIQSARQTAREKATLDLIERFESTEYYVNLRQRFSVRRKGDCFAVLLDPKTPEERTDRAAVLDYLNHYEIVAIGIQKKILDEGVYKNWMGSTLERDWNAAAGFIQKLRTKVVSPEKQPDYNEKPFANYQWLMRRWYPNSALDLYKGFNIDCQ